MLVLIGSKAAEYYGYEVMGPKRKLDTDLVGDYDEIVAYFKFKGCDQIYPIDEGKKLVGKSKDAIYEAEITWPGSTSEELHKHGTWNCFYNSYEDGPFTIAVAGPGLQYVLKMTHRFKKNSPHFLKTMADIHMLRNAGVIPSNYERYSEFYERRLKETLNYKHPKLNQDKKNFFTDTIKYKYDHDSIHEAICIQEKPAYTYFKDDQAEVLCSKEKFFELPEFGRLFAVYEESCVLALERSQIPYPNMDRRRSFNIALEKVCTSITSGWFREYAWENYHEAQRLYDNQTLAGQNYVEKFNRALEKGLVRYHES